MALNFSALEGGRKAESTGLNFSAFSTAQSTPQQNPVPQVDFSKIDFGGEGPQSRLPAGQKPSLNFTALKDMTPDRTPRVSPNFLADTTISAAPADPVEEKRQQLRETPIIGPLLLGKGENSLYEKDSIPGMLEREGIVGFLTDGFRRKLNPTRREIGEGIEQDYNKLVEEGYATDRAWQIAVDNAANEIRPDAENADALAGFGGPLNEEEEDILFWNNIGRDAFAVLDAPVFLGTTKVARKSLDELASITDSEAFRSRLLEIFPALRENTDKLDEIVEAGANARTADEVQDAINTGLRKPAEAAAPVVDDVARVADDAAPVVDDVAPIVDEVAPAVDEVLPATKSVDEVGDIPVSKTSTDVIEEAGAPRAAGPQFPNKTPETPTFRNSDELVDEVTNLRAEIEILQESIDANPARELSRFVSRKTGKLPEVTGGRTVGEVSGSGRRRDNSLFGRKGDELLADNGFSSVDEANDAIDTLRRDRKRLAELQTERGDVSKQLADFRKRQRISTSFNVNRRAQFRALVGRFNLTPTEVKRTLSKFTRGGNLSSLTENQFKRFMREAEKLGEDVSSKTATRGIVKAEIEQRGLQNTEALQQALKLPKIQDMSLEQLKEFDEILSGYKENDMFLGKRLQETIDRTDLKGARTYREVKEKLAKELDVPLEDLEKLDVSWYDRFAFDAALANQNPLYELIVDKVNKSLIEGNIRFAKFEDEIDTKIRAARKSRKRGVGDRLVPTDEQIFKYLEASDPQKMKMRKDMTQEELQAAHFLKDRYEDARQYLIRNNTMSKYVKDYVTHIRRTGLEAFRKDGVVSAIKESFDQYKVDQAQFRVMNEKTGDVLPLEKFFQFAMKRSGELKPTENVSRASQAYFMSYERKRALDAIVPELDAYVKILSPQRKTQSGLEMDPRIQTFLKQYINNKRGRPVSTFFDPGTPPDVVLRGASAATRLVDLGLSIPNFVAANVGEQATSFIQMGTKPYAKGVQRMNTKKGKEIVERYRGFVGRSPWKEINDTSKNFPDKMFTLMLSGFHDASVRANKIGLLGALSKEEMASGIVKPERLAEIRRSMNTWRSLDNTSSIYGSTSLGKVGTQYKAWAVPIVYSTQRNVRSLLKSLRSGKNPFKTEEGKQLLRETVLLSTVGLTAYNYFSDDPNSFVDEITHKSARDALSAVGALNPEMWLQTPRAIQYLQDLEEALSNIVTGERYKNGNLKGTQQLERLVTPAPVRQFKNAIPEGEESGDGLDIDLDGLDIDLDDINIDLDDIDIDL